LGNVPADCHGRLGKVMTLGLDPFFPGVALLATALAKVVAELEELAADIRRKTRDEGKALNESESHGFAP
jgi:hypothetical protein